MADPLGSWEERMAARTAQRRRDALPEDRRPDPWARSLAELVEEGRLRQIGMTLGEAMRLLRTPPWACACIGPPFCCRYAWERAAALQRAAHVSVKLFADRLARG